MQYHIALRRGEDEKKKKRRSINDSRASGATSKKSRDNTESVLLGVLVFLVFITESFWDFSMGYVLLLFADFIYTHFRPPFLLRFHVSRCHRGMHTRGKAHGIAFCYRSEMLNIDQTRSLNDMKYENEQRRQPKHCESTRQLRSAFPSGFLQTVIWVQTAGPEVITTVTHVIGIRTGKAKLACAECQRSCHSEPAHIAISRPCLLCRFAIFKPCLLRRFARFVLQFAVLGATRIALSISPSILCHEPLVLAELGRLLNLRSLFIGKKIVHVGVTKPLGPRDRRSAKLIPREQTDLAC